MQNTSVEPKPSKELPVSLHERLVAARAARSIVVTNDTPRAEIPDEYLLTDPERWDGLG